MAQKTDADLTTDANVIKNETDAGENTATRVGSHMVDLIDSKLNNENVIDEDNMASDSATKVPTQQSVKAYVDASAGAVDSVNGQTGVVVLGAGDVGADPTGTGAAAAAAILTTSISNGDTTHAPDGNSVFDALALKADLISPSFTTPSLGVATTTDDPYDDTGWNGNTQVPTKNAIRDKIEGMANSSVISNALVSTTLTADGSGKSGQIQFHDSTAISSNITYAISNMTNVTAFVQTILVTGTIVISFADEVVMQKADTRWDNTSSSKDITLTAPDTGNPYVFSFIKCGSLWLMQASGAHFTS